MVTAWGKTGSGGGGYAWDNAWANRGQRVVCDAGCPCVYVMWGARVCGGVDFVMRVFCRILPASHPILAIFGHFVAVHIL